MALSIKPSIASVLSPSIKQALASMSDEAQSSFEDEYSRKSKSATLMVILAIFFPIQLFLLGKTGLGVAFLLTAGGVWVWWIVEIFLASGRTREYNQDIASQIVRDMKIMGVK